MKRYAHYPFHAAALLSLTGMWLRWDWVTGVWDGWFPFFAVTAAELIRVKNKTEAGIIEKSSKWMQRFALASIALSFLVIGGLMLFADYTHKKANQEAVEAYLEARKAGK